VPYFSVGSPMPGPWAPPLMHFHSGWSRPAEGVDHRGYYSGEGHYGSVDHPRHRRTSRQENRMVRFPRVSSTSNGCSRLGLLHMDQGAARDKQG
jgi:hypothetical protein